MSTGFETPIVLPTFPRPTSLYVPDVPRSVPILDTTSYSPFPTFPGNSHRARDPYGLNAYLLHPDDSLWHYVDPMPDAKAPSGESVPPTVMEQRTTAPPQLGGPLKKQRSLSGLKKPSPLSQPPVSHEQDDVEEKVVQLQRRRSSSLSSSPVLSADDEVKIIESFRENSVEAEKVVKAPKSGKRTLRRAFTMARKSVFGATDIEPVPPVPAMPEISPLVAPTIIFPGSSSDAVNPSTPMTSRSNSNQSSISSASSTSSSEGVKTPAEGVSAEVAITGSKLANALQEAGEKKNKVKGWRWLGGKKGGKLAAKDADASGSITPLSDLSAASTPNTSTSDLLATAASKVTLTASPAIITPSSGSSVLPSEQLDRQHTWATEQLRRVSMRKLSQLRSPSPHPLALSLRRQHSKLPDEVAFSIRSDQRVFPMSVNSHKGSEGDLVPAQGGLWLNIAISRVMTKLDKGEQPDGILKLRKNSQKSTIPRPRGVLDFINRPPFEERNIVFYPDNLFSPISMARPGYGVWDLDFTPYILALSEIDEPSTSWPAMPRASMEDAADEFAEAIKAFGDNSEEGEGVELLKSPPLADDGGPSAALKLLTINSPFDLSNPIVSPAQSPTKTGPVSSFRPAGYHTKSSSSASSSDESDEESEEDDEPLAVVAKRRSQSFQSAPRPTTTAVASVSVRPTTLYSRSHSQPAKTGPRRHSTNLESELKWKELQQQSAMNEVARARERREANRTGEVEKLAEGEQVRARQIDKRRSSMLDLRDTQNQRQHPQPGSSSSSAHKRNSSATALVPARPHHRVPSASASQLHLAPPVEQPGRQGRRGQSTSAVVTKQSLTPPRPDNSRSRTGPAPVDEKRKRYHSFYEQKAASSSAPSFHGQPRPVHFPHVPAYPHHSSHLQIQAQVQSHGGMPGFPHAVVNPMQRGSMYGMPMTPYGLQGPMGMGMSMGIGSPAGAKRGSRMA